MLSKEPSKEVQLIDIYAAVVGFFAFRQPGKLIQFKCDLRVGFIDI